MELNPWLQVGDNLIEIELDNQPESSRWYPGGGIYRNVWLTKTAPVAVEHWGTWVTAKADGSVRVEIRLKADAPEGYLPVKLQKPANGVTPDGQTYTYSANDASVADVDGDGQYEIILKWDPSNAHDNAHDGFTGPTIFDCYNITSSQLLWRIDMGINIRSGAHYVPFIVYDLDGDGKAEFIVRTADGTRDSKGNVVGDSTADYRHRAPENAQLPMLATPDPISTEVMDVGLLFHGAEPFGLGL